MNSFKNASCSSCKRIPSEIRPSILSGIYFRIIFSMVVIHRFLQEFLERSLELQNGIIMVSCREGNKRNQDLGEASSAA